MADAAAEGRAAVSAFAAAVAIGTAAPGDRATGQ